MDPTTNLTEQISLANSLVDYTPSRSTVEKYVNDAQRLSELVLALNEWLCKKGFLPEQWKK